MYEKLIEAIHKARRFEIFTGAGISTLSGIRDFRGANGVYAEAWRGHDVEDILSLDFFRRDPSIFYAWSKEFCYRTHEYEPNIVHKVIAKFETIGKIRGVYTQNIDLLHQKAGNRHVWEIHGSPANHRCLKCGKCFSYEEIAPIVMRDEVPKCDTCKSIVKPDIVFYGESLDRNLLSRAFENMSEADLVLVLGTSLTVQPAASLPLAALQSGADVYIVNAQSTPLDRMVEARYEDLKTVFEALERAF